MVEYLLHDMLGNVWEWGDDWFGSYQIGRQENRAGAKEENAKVMRGGSWDSDPQYVRVSYRIWYEPTYRSSNFGFRCAGD